MMNKRVRQLFVCCFCYLAAVVVVTKPTLAQTPAQTTPDTPPPTSTPTPTPLPEPEKPINLTLSPISVQFDVKPGETQTAEIKIRNNSDETENLTVTFGTFAFNQRTQEIDLSQEIIDESKDWISVDEPRFSVDSQEWKTLKLTFSPPAEAVLTHYYAVIFNRTVNAKAKGGETQVSGAPAILVLTNVESPLGKRELQIDQFFANKFWVEFLPQTFTLKIKNTGNIHLNPSGNVFIDGQGKKDLAILSINPKNSIVLPNSTREFTIEWDDGFPKRVQKDTKEITEPGKNDTEIEWNFSEADKFRIGKYTAHLLLVYDNGERDVPIETQISFWVIPWRICLAVFFIALFVLIGLRSFIRDIFVKIKRMLKPPSSRPSPPASP